MFSLTNEQRVFKPHVPACAVYPDSGWGPNFYYALGVMNPMNGENNGLCETEGSE